MKIGILTNESTMLKCTGTGCLKAMSLKEDAFSGYDSVELMTFTHLGGDLEKKIAKMKATGIERVHVSTCARSLHADYEEICMRLSEDFDVIGYTHGGKISKKGIEALIIKRNPL